MTMPDISVEVRVFNPLFPDQRIRVRDPGMDTWHDRSLISQRLVNRLPEIRPSGRARLDVSGGMHVEVDAVEVGIDIGGLRIERLTALVVTDGQYDVLLGADILKHVFRIGEAPAQDVRIRSPLKDDPTALAVELYPVESPVELRKFQQFLHGQRRLHNIAVVASGVIGREYLATLDLEDVLENETALPNAFRLRLQWVDNGSIWLTIKSGSTAALEYVAQFFKMSATARLARLQAEARKSANDAAIGEATRASTVERIRTEEERLQSENIAATYATWRTEVRQKLDLLDELISRTEDPEVAAVLMKKRDEALLMIADQTLVPIVRSLPRELPEEDPGVHLLPPVPPKR
jgi:hypothetical protein